MVPDEMMINYRNVSNVPERARKRWMQVNSTLSWDSTPYCIHPSVDVGSIQKQRKETAPFVLVLLKLGLILRLGHDLSPGPVDQGGGLTLMFLFSLIPLCWVK